MLPKVAIEVEVSGQHLLFLFCAVCLDQIDDVRKMSRSLQHQVLLTDLEEHRDIKEHYEGGQSLLYVLYDLLKM